MKEILNKVEAGLLNISEPQRLLLLLMEYASFNEFHGTSVVRDLVQHRDLWEACLMTNFINGLKPDFPLINLRDLHPSVEKRLGYPIYNVNTLYVLTRRKDALIKMAGLNHWKCGSSYIMSKENSDHIMGGMATKEKNLRIVRFWWD
jgi:hypothetical protein